MEFFLLELISSLLIKRGTRHLTELYDQLLGKCCNTCILGRYFWTGNAVILVVLGKDNCCVVEFVLVCETSNFDRIWVISTQKRRITGLSCL